MFHRRNPPCLTLLILAALPLAPACTSTDEPQWDVRSVGRVGDALVHEVDLDEGTYLFAAKPSESAVAVPVEAPDQAFRAIVGDDGEIVVEHFDGVRVTTIDGTHEDVEALLGAAIDGEVVATDVGFRQQDNGAAGVAQDFWKGACLWACPTYDGMTYCISSCSTG